MCQHPRARANGCLQFHAGSPIPVSHPGPQENVLDPVTGASQRTTKKTPAHPNRPRPQSLSLSLSPPSPSLTAFLHLTVAASPRVPGLRRHKTRPFSDSAPREPSAQTWKQLLLLKSFRGKGTDAKTRFHPPRWSGDARALVSFNPHLRTCFY